MNTPMLLEMAADGMADRLAVGGRHDDDGVTYAALLDRARRVAAVLGHKHLASYVISTVEFMGAADDHAALVSVPPYHVAGMATILTSLYGGRRLVYLPQFDPERWVDTARHEGITHAFVVPTMLGRILDVLEARGETLPGLVHLAYGGGRMPAPVVERALALLPGVGFVNAYGLTETASDIAP